MIHMDLSGGNALLREQKQELCKLYVQAAQKDMSLSNCIARCRPPCSSCFLHAEPDRACKAPKEAKATGGKSGKKKGRSKKAKKAVPSGRTEETIEEEEPKGKKRKLSKKTETAKPVKRRER